MIQPLRIRSPEELDELISENDISGLAPRIAQAYWDKPESLTRSAAAANSLKVTRRGVRNIAIFFHALGIGGGERVTRDLALLWQSMGLNVVIITNEKSTAEDLAVPSDIKRIVIPSYVGCTPENYAFRSEALRTTLIENDIDVLVFAQWFSDTIAFDMMSAKLTGAAVLLFIQSSFTQFFLDPDLPSKYASIPLQYNLADGIVCLSEMDRLFWARFAKRAFLTHNPLSQTPPPHEKLAKLEGHNIIWPARLHTDKYPLRVVPIMERLLESVPDAKLWMIGPVDPSIEAELAKAAAAKGEAVASSIEIIGSQSPDQMEQWYRKSDVFLLTSKREGWSLALGEALALGIPCVVYDLPYLTLVQDNPGVIRIPQGDAQAAADALAKVLLDKEFAHQAGEGGWRFMRDIARYDYKAFWSNCFSSVLETAEDEQKDNKARHSEQQTEALLWQELLEAYQSHLASFEDERGKLHGELSARQHQIDERDQKIAQIESEIQAIRESRSFKIGTALMTIPYLLKVSLTKARRKGNELSNNENRQE